VRWGRVRLLGEKSGGGGGGGERVAMPKGRWGDDDAGPEAEEEPGMGK